ncbi:MAG TPA: UDP-N-acetylmuramate:L-alanyl-gamma-D-glutamyl-meso-diaminopimelate ligase, partial [Vicinamibacteria bacterium]
VFQEAFVSALGEADAAILAAVFSSKRLPADQELSEERVIEGLREAGKTAWFIPQVEEIVTFLDEKLGEGDVVLGMSNGGFGGFHRKLLERLAG